MMSKNHVPDIVDKLIAEMLDTDMCPEYKSHCFSSQTIKLKKNEPLIQYTTEIHSSTIELKDSIHLCPHCGNTLEDDEQKDLPLFCRLNVLRVKGKN